MWLYCEKRTDQTLWLRKPFKRVKQFDPSPRAAVETNPTTMDIKAIREKSAGLHAKSSAYRKWKGSIRRENISCAVKKSANTVSDSSELSTLLRYNLFKLISLNRRPFKILLNEKWNGKSREKSGKLRFNAFACVSRYFQTRSPKRDFVFRICGEVWSETLVKKF